MSRPSPFSLISRSVKETAELAERVAKRTKNGDVVALEGELGTGKTVFAKAFAAALGIAEPITSPTFGLIMEYQRPNRDWLFHLDLYRINDCGQALAFGVDEYLLHPQGITVIEWPERIVDLLPPDTAAKKGRLLYFKLRHHDQTSREIILPQRLDTD